jgi:hypothetical protein
MDRNLKEVKGLLVLTDVSEKSGILEIRFRGLTLKPLNIAIYVRQIVHQILSEK